MKKIEDHLRWNADVRYELYGVLNDMRALQNHHLKAWGAEHQPDCRFCADFEQKRAGVLWAIRSFGGKPRQDWE